MAPHGKRTFGWSGIAVGLVCALLVGMPRVAHADLGDEPSKSDSSSSSSSQLEDSDRPKESILDKKPADAAVASKKAQAPVGPPFYENWKFWAVAGGVVVGVIAAVIVGQKVAHQVNGGDVRPCNMDFLGRCFGEGR